MNTMIKKFNVLSLFVLISMVLAACGGGNPAPGATATTAPAGAETVAPAGAVTVAPAGAETVAPVATAATVSKYSQAPMLDDLVKSGKLPALDQRLPVDVFTVGPGIYLTKEQLPDWQ